MPSRRPPSPAPFPWLPSSPLTPERTNQQPVRRCSEREPSPTPRGSTCSSATPAPTRRQQSTSNPQSSNPTIHLLEFDITDPAQARYLASGSVPGQLHDSYALSEYQDHLRVTTTTTKNGTTSTGVSVLARQGDRLVQVGSVSGLGTGEQVYAVRYAGDRGYVVTFQRIDPLHVIDLSNPVKPVLRGTLSHDRLLQPAAAAVGRPAARHRPRRHVQARCPASKRVRRSSSRAVCSCHCST